MRIYNNLKPKCRVSVKRYTKEVSVLKQIERQANEGFGVLLRHYRLKKGYTLEELEKMSGISRSYLCRIENDERNSPSYEKVYTLAKLLNIKLPQLENLSKKEEKDIFGILLSVPYTINDRRVTPKTKELIVRLLDYVISCRWDEDRIKNILEVEEIISSIKEQLIAK